MWAAVISGWRGVPVGRTVWLGIALAMSGALLLAAVDLRVSGEALLGDLLALADGAFAARCCCSPCAWPRGSRSAAGLLLAGLAVVVRAGSRGSVPSVPVE